MNQLRIAIFRVKFKGLIQSLRTFYLRLLGLKIKEGTSVGNIICDWPSKVFIGEDCVLRDKIVFWFRNPFNIEHYISIGNRTFIGNNCEFNCNYRIIIGCDVLIASNTVIVDNNHQIIKNKIINTQPVSVGEVIISDDVWIGTGCIILMGIQIGRGAVVAAGAVVTKNIPKNEIWGGVPAKKIGERKI